MYRLRRMPAIALLVCVLLSACYAYDARLSKQQPWGQNVNSAQAGSSRAIIKAYEGFWSVDDFSKTELAGPVFRPSTTMLELHVAEDGQSGTINFMILWHPYDSTIAFYSGHWIMDGPDRAVFWFDEDGRGSRRTDTPLFRNGCGNGEDGMLLFRGKAIIVVTRYAENSLFKFPFGCVFRQAEPTGPGNGHQWGTTRKQINSLKSSLRSLC